MMGRLKSDQGQLFYEFHLSDAVPEDHLVRKIDTALDLFWLRSHDTANPRRVFISGRKRGVFGAIECELRRRSAIEPVIGHRKTDGHLGRCHLNAERGNAANVVLTAIGHNLRRVIAWLKACCA